jgi:mono/diheme cytochrome c family protein
MITAPCYPAEPTFEKDVTPLFAKSCVSCHGPEKQKGGFRADTLAGVLTSGDSGPWTAPGDSGASKLVELLSGKIRTKKAADKHEMSASEVQLVRRWIDAGAK